MLTLNYTLEMLGLEEGIVTGVDQKEKETVIHLEMPRKFLPCPRCQNLTDAVHDYRKQRIKDIPAFGRFVTLLLRKRRYHCNKCEKSFYETVPFLPKYHRMTSRLSAYMVNEFRKVSSVKDIAERNHVSTTTAARIFDHVCYREPSLPNVLSIDEFRGNAGGEKFQCILTNPKERRVIDILENRKSEDLYAYFSRCVNRENVVVLSSEKRSTKSFEKGSTVIEPCADSSMISSYLAYESVALIACFSIQRFVSRMRKLSLLMSMT